MTDDAHIENATDGEEAVPSVLESIPEEQRNSWEGPARTSDLPPADQYAAILYKGGPEGSAREIQEEFDLWVFTTSTEVILKAKDDRIIMADTLDDLQRRLDARYPAPPACSFLKHDVHTIRLNWVKQEDRWGRSRRSEYKRKQIRGWVVLKHPLVLDYIDMDQVRQLSLHHGAILLDKDNVNHEKFMEAGFSPVGGGHELIKVRWNPKAVALRDWRKAVKVVEAMHVEAFDESLIRAFTVCFNPTHWDHKFPFKDILGHYNEGVDWGDVHLYVKLAHKLRPGSKPWRKVDGRGGHDANYLTALTALLPFIRIVLKKGSSSNKRIARFVLAEAKAMRMVVPPIPAIPPKPFSRKPKKQQKQKGVGVALTDDGTPNPELAPDVQPLGEIGEPAPEFTVTATTAAIAA